MSLEMQMHEQGYEAGAPDWGVIDGASIDGPICADSACSECGHQGMDYKPFVKRERKSYRAFAVCPECGYEEEF